MCYTKVTAGGISHEMWLPVMDNSNASMKSEPYEYQTRNGKKTCQAYTMFDINKTLMRCLVKNLAMFGLALYIYSGEDLPEEDAPDLTEKAQEWVTSIKECKTIDELKTEFGFAYKELSKDKNALDLISQAKDARKAELEKKNG